MDSSPVISRLPNWDPAPREPHLLDYLIILRKHQWLIISFLLAVVTLVTIATFRMRPIYVSTARIAIDRENANVLPFQGSDAYALYEDTEAYIETQSKILQSETLALHTIRSVGLVNQPDFGSGDGRPSEVLITGSLANQKRPPALGAFLGGLSVKRVPTSRLLDVSFESTDPLLASRIVNAHLDNFIEQNFRSKYESITQASQWLAGQLNELKVKVQKAEDARITYERQNQIWTIDEKQSITTQKLGEINKELTDAQSDRMKKEAIYQLAQSGSLDALPGLRDSDAMKGLLVKRQEAVTAHADALNQYGPNFPKVQRLQAQIIEMDQLLEKEKKNIVAQVANDYRAARQREQLFSEALDKQKAETNAMAERLVQYNILKREADASKQLYDGLLMKLKEAGISAGLRSSNIRVVDPATVPSYPSRPSKTRNIALGFLVGLIGGIGLALLREYLDNTVKTPDDVERLSRLPSLAVVPAFASLNGQPTKRKLLGMKARNGHDSRVELVSHTLPKSQMSEAFRALRTSLLLSQADHPPQVILVTSALPREGKTTAAANLAVTLAQLGDRTLLIDADLRKPGAGRALGLTDAKYAGLSSYLAGVSSLEQVLVPHQTISNLSAILTGPIPPNPADLLSSHRLADAIVELRQQFKFIVIDSPPIMAATDAVIISVKADGVLIVVRSGETPKQAFSRTRDLLASVKCQMLGVVLNAVDSSAPDYYYSYRYYPYSYGHEREKLKEHSTEASMLNASEEENHSIHEENL
ncbi:MAG TPA: polysaccharide biosynthesis tyrosine autokinase [Candidatus Dormibacteraeota bacterium]|nr:polysaccharide biosynthesis tyrosine autokinase [Candidatus Dormibacteraeota bacterium]